MTFCSCVLHISGAQTRCHINPLNSAVRLESAHSHTPAIPCLLDIEFAWSTYILGALGPGGCRCLAITSKSLYARLSRTTAAWSRERWDWIHKRFPRAIRDLLGGPARMIGLPRLAWRSCFLGGTGYIDGVISTDMSAPLMLGSRPGPDGPAYVALRTEGQDGHRAVTVLFQRYPGRLGTWASSDYGRVVCECGHFLVEGEHNHVLLAFYITILVEGRSTVMRFAHLAGGEIVAVPRWLA